MIITLENLEELGGHSIECITHACHVFALCDLDLDINWLGVVCEDS